MTTCFVLQFGTVCLAAADTRISAAGSTGLPAATWDAADMPTENENGTCFIIPYRFRKIRQLRFGWAVTAGTYISGDHVLGVLNRHQANGAAHVQEILHEEGPNGLHCLANLPHGEASGPLQAQILGVPANQDRTGVWVAHIDRTAAATVDSFPSFARNWPESLSVGQKAEAEERFSNALSSFSHMGDLVRAAADLIGSARSAPDSGPIVQIGLTWQVTPTDFETRYIDGHVDEIAGMTNDEILREWEVLPA